MRGADNTGIVRVQQNKAAKTLFITIPKEAREDLQLQPQQKIRVEKDDRGNWILSLLTPKNEDCYA